MKTMMKVLFGISILFLLIGAVSANENTTDDLLQTAPEKVEFKTTEIDIEDKNTPILSINTTDNTKEIIIESYLMGDGEASKVTVNTDYKPQTLEIKLKDLNLNYVGDYQVSVHGKGAVIPYGISYNEKGEWDSGYGYLKVTADKKFSIGKYSITLSDSEYNCLRNIKEIEKTANLRNYKAGDYYGEYAVWSEYDMATDSYQKSLTYTVTKYTGKTVKQKIGVGYKWKTIKNHATKSAATKAMKKLQKKTHYVYTIKKIKKNGKTKYQVCKRVWKKIVTKNAKVYISIDYGGFNSAPHKFTMRVHTKYQNAGENLISGAVKGYKVTGSFLKLKT